MVSTRTENRNRKIDMLKEGLNIIVELLLMEKRQVERANMANYKRMLSELKAMKKEAESYGKVINEDPEFLVNE